MRKSDTKAPPRGRPKGSKNGPKLKVQEAFPNPNGLYRLSDLLSPGRIPVSRATWWNGIRKGIFPKGRKLGPNTTVWLGADIQAVIDGLKAAETSQRGEG